MSISTKDLCYTYQSSFDAHALKNVNLELEDHCFLALVGETGSGKSTLVQNLNGLLTPTSGEIKMGNYVIRVIDSKRQLIDLSLSQEEVNKLRKKKREKQFELKKLRKYAGLVFQFPEYQLFEESVLKDVMFGPKNFGIKDEEAKKLAIEALKSCNIDSSYFSRSPFELSGGEKRRVAIAGILALDPEVLVLDEPTAGLDPQGEKEMMALFEKIYESGKSVIIVIHNMDLVLKYARTVVVMSKGEVVKKGNPLDVFVDEELLKNVAIEPPYVIKVALALKEKGIDIDLTKVKDIPSLAKEIGGKIHG